MLDQHPFRRGGHRHSPVAGAHSRFLLTGRRIGWFREEHPLLLPLPAPLPLTNHTVDYRPVGGKHLVPYPAVSDAGSRRPGNRQQQPEFCHININCPADTVCHPAVRGIYPQLDNPACQQPYQHIHYLGLPVQTDEATASFLRYEECGGHYATYRRQRPHQIVPNGFNPDDPVLIC